MYMIGILCFRLFWSVLIFVIFVEFGRWVSSGVKGFVKNFIGKVNLNRNLNWKLVFFVINRKILFLVYKLVLWVILWSCFFGNGFILWEIVYCWRICWVILCIIRFSGRVCCLGSIEVGVVVVVGLIRIM